MGGLSYGLYLSLLLTDSQYRAPDKNDYRGLLVDSCTRHKNSDLCLACFHSAPLTRCMFYVVLWKCKIILASIHRLGGFHNTVAEVERSSPP